ncbi:MAG: carbohydrate binding family 9 domain-containing protein, partial [Armatimonadota bacterium]|nr:carbohydrate binding family 9 domain-containing protein [Armatimonadota bacterium]
GNIDDEVWKKAPVARDFWISEFGRVAREPTEVRVLADATALYFAFACYDSKPEHIFARQLKRDGDLGSDDQVTIQLDPYHNHRQISDFSVNAEGTQSDAMAGGRARNIKWKGDWQAATQRGPKSWTAEIAIPFAILNFQPRADTFGVNFVRYHHRTQEASRWADITPKGLAEEMGHLTGLVTPGQLLARKLTMMQYATLGVNSPNKRGSVRDRLATTGLDLRHNFRNNLTSVFSLNPDFSQVDEEVLDLGFSYNEKFRQDNRPFFQEGSAYFGNRALFYSGRIPNFNLGAKSFGRIGPTQLGFLALQAPGGRRDYVARVLREFGPVRNASLMLVGTQRDDFNNRLLSFQTSGRLRGNLALDAEWSTTSTQGRPGVDLLRTPAKGRRGDGSRRRLALNYFSTYWQSGVALEGTDRNFFPADGFIEDDSIGTRGGSVYLSHGRDYERGLLRRFDVNLSYGQFDTVTGLSQSRSFSVYASAQTRSNILLSMGTTQGPYRPRDRDTLEPADSINHDRFYTAAVYLTPNNNRYGYGITHSWGFLGGGDYHDTTPSFWLRPTQHTFLSYSSERAESFGLSTQQVLASSWEINPQQSISMRWIQSDGSANFYRAAYRREVQHGIDVYAVFDTNPFNRNRFTVKLVRTFS